MKTAIVIKMHDVTKRGLKLITKIFNECSGKDKNGKDKGKGLTIFLLFHGALSNDKNTKIKQFNLPILQFTTDMIKNHSQFISTHKSNHLGLFLHYEQLSSFDYIWSIEYDVWINGNSNKLFNFASDKDLLYPYYYYGRKPLNGLKIYCGYVQLVRYSSKLFSAINDMLANSKMKMKLTDEEMIFTATMKNNLSCLSLRRFIAGRWTHLASESKYNKLKMEDMKANEVESLAIFHPVK